MVVQHAPNWSKSSSISRDVVSLSGRADADDAWGDKEVIENEEKFGEGDNL